MPAADPIARTTNTAAPSFEEVVCTTPMVLAAPVALLGAAPPELPLAAGADDPLLVLCAPEVLLRLALESVWFLAISLN